MNCREIRCNIQGPWMKNLMTEGKHTRYFWFCVSKCWFYCHLSRPGFSALTVKVGASSCRNLLRINSNWTSACVCKESKGSADSSELPTEEISQLWEETLAPPLYSTYWHCTVAWYTSVFIILNCFRQLMNRQLSRNNAPVLIAIFFTCITVSYVDEPGR